MDHNKRNLTEKLWVAVYNEVTDCVKIRETNSIPARQISKLLQHPSHLMTL